MKSILFDTMHYLFILVIQNIKVSIVSYRDGLSNRWRSARRVFPVDEFFFFSVSTRSLSERKAILLENVVF